VLVVAPAATATLTTLKLIQTHLFPYIWQGRLMLATARFSISPALACIHFSRHREMIRLRPIFAFAQSAAVVFLLH
jgi:hypothetical protein